MELGSGLGGDERKSLSLGRARVRAEWEEGRARQGFKATRGGMQRRDAEAERQERLESETTEVRALSNWGPRRSMAVHGTWGLYRVQVHLVVLADCWYEYPGSATCKRCEQVHVRVVQAVVQWPRWRRDCFSSRGDWPRTTGALSLNGPKARVDGPLGGADRQDVLGTVRIGYKDSKRSGRTGLDDSTGAGAARSCATRWKPNGSQNRWQESVNAVDRARLAKKSQDVVIWSAVSAQLLQSWC